MINNLKYNISASYFASLPASIRYDPNFSDKQKLFYAELSAHLNMHGYCDKGNRYFAGIMEVSERTISRFVTELKDRKYITVDVVDKIRRISLPITQVSFIQPPKQGKQFPDDDPQVVIAKKLLTYWEDELKCRLNAKRMYIKTILERLEEFSESELITAMKNRINFVTNSDWHAKPENRRHINDVTKVIRDSKSVITCLAMNNNSEEKTTDGSLSAFNEDAANNDILK